LLSQEKTAANVFFTALMLFCVQEMFTETGRGQQAFVGFIKSPNEQPMFIKVARDISFVIQHEHTVAQCVCNKDHLRPNFLNVTTLLPLYSQPISRLKAPEDVLIVPDAASIPKQAMRMEYIANATPFHEWIELHRHKLHTHIYPVMRHVLALIRMAQEAVSFVHYDLHIENILMRPCADANRVRVFQFKNGEQYIIKCLDMEPVIIDYGRAYCDALEGTAVNAELLNTQAAVFSVVPHMGVDYIFFLNSCAKHIRDVAKNTSLDKALRPFTKHLEKYGWWDNKELSALDRAASLVRVNVGPSILFRTNLEQCLTVFAHLCIIPLRRVDDYNSSQYWTYYFGKFLAQWIKLEKWFCEATVARLEYFFSYCMSTLSFYREAYFDVENRVNAEQDIIRKLDEFMNIECGNMWSSDGIIWGEFIRCGFLAGRMLEGLLAETVEQQFAAYSQLTSKATFFNLFPLIPNDAPIDTTTITGGEIVDAQTESIKECSRDEILTYLRQRSARPAAI